MIFKVVDVSFEPLQLLVSLAVCVCVCASRTILHNGGESGRRGKHNSPTGAWISGSMDQAFFSWCLQVPLGQKQLRYKSPALAEPHDEQKQQAIFFKKMF